MSITSGFCHFKELPSEILGTVFSFLPSNSVARCERVCKIFQESIQVENVWSVLVKRDFHISPVADCKLAYQNETKNAELVIKLKQFLIQNTRDLDSLNIDFRHLSNISNCREWVSSNPVITHLLLRLIVKKSEAQAIDYSEIIHFLLNMGAPINEADKPGYDFSSSLFNLSLKLYHRKPEHCFTLLKILFEYGIQVHEYNLKCCLDSDTDGKLVLYVTNLFIELGVHLTRNGLNSAVKKSYPEVIEIVDKFLNQGVDPSEDTLIKACKNDSSYGYEVVSKLLQKGVPVTQDVLEESSHSQFKDLLLKYRAKALGNWELHRIAEECLDDSPNLMRAVLSRGGHSQEGMRLALTMAIRNLSSQGTEMVRLLLCAGVQADESDLFISIRRSTQTMKILLEHGVPCDQFSLQNAAENTSNSALEKVSALLDVGCSPSSDALKCAAMNPSPQAIEIVSLLLARGAQPTSEVLRSACGNTSDQAVQIVELLLKAGAVVTFELISYVLTCSRRDELYPLLFEAGKDPE